MNCTYSNISFGVNLYVCSYLMMSFYLLLTEGQWGHFKHGEDKGKSCNEDSLQICMYPCVNICYTFLSCLCV